MPGLPPLPSASEGRSDDESRMAKPDPRSAAKKVEGKHSRTWPERFVLGISMVAIVGALGTAVVVGYSNQKLGQITRIQVSGALRSPKETPPGAPLNYLLVGSDDDTGLPADAPERRGRQSVGGKRTDTIMVLRIDPKDTTARLLSFPRDLWVTLSSSGGKGRINEAFEGNDGAVQLIETIKQNFGVPIDHYVQVNLASFKNVVEAIDGVPMYFPEPARSRDSGLDIKTAGCWTLDGTQALAFVRARKDYQTLEDGRWVTDPTSDLGRISRQQSFIQTALKRAIAKGVRNPVTLRRLVDLSVRTVDIDDKLKLDDIMRLGSRFRSFNPDNLIKYSIPATDAVKGAAQVLEVDEAAAEPILDIFRGTGTSDATASDAELTPSQVRVQVLNGAGIEGQARKVTNELTLRGFVPSAPGDAPRGSTTLVRYAPGHSTQARLVARYLVGPVTFQETDEVIDTDVVVTTGADFQGTRETPKADTEVPAISTSTTTTTTQPNTTTTTTTLVGEVPQAPPGVKCG